ncbi:MAG: patatin-like phospholipase family protein [Acidobacteriota bacterium]
MPPSPSRRSDLAIVLGGGGARAAYQVGLLRTLARHRPNIRFPIITGVSAGAINAIYLASHGGNLYQATEGLQEIWSDLETDQVFRVDAPSLSRMVLSWGLRLISGGVRKSTGRGSLVDTAPLDALLHRCLQTRDREVVGVERNIEAGKLHAMALTTLDYGTGQTVTWYQGRDIADWERPHRKSARCRMSIDHVMASAALPLLFPAVRLTDSWHGDGGVRLAAPLSPALHLGASRILAVSTRYDRSREEADVPLITGYPPPAQVLGLLMNAIFLDLMDQDVLRMKLMNQVISDLPPERRGNLRTIDIEVLRPSVDLGKLAGQFEVRLPRAFRFLTRGLGTRETKSPDFLSLLMFQHDYLQQLMEIGEADAEARIDDLLRLVDGPEEQEA